jgi:hypothetical protein
MRETLQDSIHNWQADEGITEATMLTGQLEVIAEELRTANMIAFYNMDNDDADRLIKHGLMTNEKFEALAKNIIERLGLK